jgi:RNA recognition motif-containing protein
MAQHANLYVAGLPEGIDDQSFQMLFEGSGSIVSAKCVPEKRCGFVKYASKEEAQAVIDAMDGYDFSGTQLVVKFANNDSDNPGGCKGGKGAAGWNNGWNQSQGKGAWSGAKGGKIPFVEADPSDNLYIKGLPAELDQASCEALFGGYGQVMQAKVMNYGNESSALVRMANTEMAQWIVDNLNGNIPEGLEKAIQVRFADNPTAKAKKVQIFGPTGKGAPVRPSPFGAEGVEAGDVQYGNTDPTLPPHVKEGVDIVLANMGSGEKKKVLPGDQTNLYVKDLPAGADELYIYKVFSPFGALESAFVKPSPDGTWAIAFVKFRTEEEALMAIQGLSGCLLPDGSMLKVAVKTGKF